MCVSLIINQLQEYGYRLPAYFSRAEIVLHSHEFAVVFFTSPAGFSFYAS